MLQFLLPPLIFLFGATIGSFLNVVILRSIADKSLRGRSACPHCQKTLRWWELVPLFSFTLLAGRCARCRAEISVQYPLVELATGIFALVFFLPLPTSVAAVSAGGLFIIAALLLVLFVVDLKTMLLPDLFVVLLGVVIIGMLILERGDWLEAAHGALIGSGFLLFLWLITRGRGIGLGDVKLMLPLGLLFGIVGTTALLFIAFLAGGLWGSVLLLRRQASLKTAIPFGPFLCGAALLLLLWPDLPTRLLWLLWYN
jgi:leader peptidase (prepilin peptidase)/N-methyltransferase